MLFFFSVVLFVVISNDHDKHDLPSLIFGYACAFLLFLWSFYYMTINREKALYTFYEDGISGFKQQTGHHFIPWSDIQDISLQSVEINGTTITYFVIHPYDIVKYSQSPNWLLKLTQLYDKSVLGSHIAIHKNATNVSDVKLAKIFDECFEKYKR